MTLPRGFVHRNAFERRVSSSKHGPTSCSTSAVPETLLALARIGCGVAVVPSAQPARDESLRTHVIVYQGHSMGNWMALNSDARRLFPAICKTLSTRS